MSRDGDIRELELFLGPSGERGMYEADPKTRSEPPSPENSTCIGTMRVNLNTGEFATYDLEGNKDKPMGEDYN